ncbi:MAG: TatD family hydrolase, partial [Deltaproteobacteria bacterium]
RGKRNEPAHVRRVADTIGELRGIDAGQVASAALENFRRLFRP